MAGLSVHVTFRKSCDRERCLQVLSTKFAHYLNAASNLERSRKIQPVNIYLALTLPEERGENSHTLMDRITNPNAVQAAVLRAPEGLELRPRPRDAKWQGVTM